LWPIRFFRVDAVYGDTLRIASGLGHTAKQTDEARDENNPDNEDDNQAGKLSLFRFFSTVIFYFG
jgi:hypothetical protein